MDRSQNSVEWPGPEDVSDLRDLLARLAETFQRVQLRLYEQTAKRIRTVFGSDVAGEPERNLVVRMPAAGGAMAEVEISQHELVSLWRYRVAELRVEISWPPAKGSSADRAVTLIVMEDSAVRAELRVDGVLAASFDLPPSISPAQ